MVIIGFYPMRHVVRIFGNNGHGNPCMPMDGKYIAKKQYQR
jgi:hypothetical protein